MKKRIISALLAAMLMMCAVFMYSCGDSTPVVMTLGSEKITAAMYHYWACSCKGNYMYNYDDVKNTDEYWSSEVSDGVTAAEYFDGITLDNVKTTLAVMKMFDEYGLSIEKSKKDSISDYITDLIKERADGSKNMMNTMLGEYGVNLKVLEKIYLEEAKSSYVFDYLYGEDGAEALDDDDFEQFYTENYVHFNMIYINDAYQYVLDSNGKMVTGEDGYYQTKELDDEAAAKAAADIADANARLEAGEDFEVLYKEYDQLGERMDYYYTAAASYSEALYYQLVAAAAKLNDYEITTVKSDDLGTCIIQKLPLEAGAWKDTKNKAYFPTEGENTIKSQAEYRAFTNKIAEYYDDIEVDEEAIKEFSVTDITPCYFF